MSCLISVVSVVGMSSLFFIGADRADPMPSKNGRQGRSSNIFFFTTVYCRDTVSTRGLTVWLTGALKQIPLAYRVGARYTHLGNQGRAHEQINRFGPRYPGPLDLEDPGVRATPRLGDRAAVETGLRRRPAGQRRVALPCPAQGRAKFYSLTRLGRKELEKEAANWNRLSTAISR